MDDVRIQVTTGRPPSRLLSTCRLLLVVFAVLSLLPPVVHAEVRISIHERHAFSLSTFDKSGKLEQVERAIMAASQGVPLIFVKLSSNNDNTLLMAAPQPLPNIVAFYLDDGTPRFAPISPSMVVAHSGMSADGRVLIQSAQRLAVEHAYTFDEEIPAALLLEEMSLLLQEYTMKPGARPFGCTLVVGVAVETENDDEHDDNTGTELKLYRIDASGTVSQLATNGDGMDKENIAMINGGPLEKDEVFQQELQDLSKDTTKSVEEQREALYNSLQDALERAETRPLSKAGTTSKPSNKKSAKEEKDANGKNPENEGAPDTTDDPPSLTSSATTAPAALSSMRIITASFVPKKQGFVVERRNTKPR